MTRLTKSAIVYTVATIGVITIILFACVCGMIETTYTMNATVTQINHGSITVATDNGDEWVYFGDEVSKGDKVILIMNTNNTDNNYKDDKIIRVKRKD